MLIFHPYSLSSMSIKKLTHLFLFFLVIFYPSYQARQLQIGYVQTAGHSPLHRIRHCDVLCCVALLQRTASINTAGRSIRPTFLFSFMRSLPLIQHFRCYTSSPGQTIHFQRHFCFIYVYFAT